MIVTGVRHVGVESIEKAARFAAKCGHPLVTGFGVAGDERMGTIEDYVRAFEIAREAGLGITVHAGEFGGPRKRARRARPHPPLAHRPRRARHRGCRPRPAHRRRRRRCWRCAPPRTSSSRSIPSFAEHPFVKLRAAGCKVTLNSDDPPYFWTSLKREYEIGRDEFGLSDKDLTALDPHRDRGGLLRPQDEAGASGEGGRQALIRSGHRQNAPIRFAVARHLPRFAGEDPSSRTSATLILPCEAGEGTAEGGGGHRSLYPSIRLRRIVEPLQQPLRSPDRPCASHDPSAPSLR